MVALLRRKVVLGHLVNDARELFLLLEVDKAVGEDALALMRP